MLAIGAHATQVDKNGVPYRFHLRAVAEGLEPFGPVVVMAGWLHDIIEDTAWTAEGLRKSALRVPESSKHQASVLGEGVDAVPALVRVLEEWGVLA